MAKVTVKANPEYILTLTLEEAQFVQALVQNPIGDPDTELVERAKIREELFNALKHAGVRS